MIRPLTIRIKLLAIFFVAALVPIALVSLISYHNSVRAVEEMVGNRTEKLARTVRDDLSRKLGGRLKDRLLVVNRPTQDFLDAVGRHDADSRMRAYLELEDYARTLFEEYGTYYRDLTLTDRAGNPVFSFGRSRVPVAAAAMTEGQVPRPVSSAEFLDSLAVAIPEEIPLPGQLARDVEAFSRKLRAQLKEKAKDLEALQDSLRRNRPRGVDEEREAAELAKALERVAEALPVEVTVQDFVGPEVPGDLGGRLVGPPAPPLASQSEDLRAAGRAGLQLSAKENLVYIHRSPTGHSKSVRLIRPVFSVDRPQLRLGSLILDIRVDYLFPEDLSSERFGTKGEVAVVSTGDGEILYHTNPERVGQSLRLVDARLHAAIQESREEQEKSWMELPAEKGVRLASIYEVGVVPWTVVATSFPREFATETQRAGLINLLVASVAVILALIVLLAASGRISNSIHVVTGGAREIAAGNLNHSIRVNTHDEIQTLAETFNVMTASLRENIALREKAVEELAALNRTLEERVHERTQELEALNRALKLANEELQELDRLKSSFLATVSHEFKTPLTSITAFSEILLDEVDEYEAPAEAKRFLGIINTESERLGRLIKNLLDLSRIEAGRMKWDRSTFRIQDVILAALDGLLPVFGEKKIRLIRGLDCEGILVNADRDRVQQVITNLLENAVKFSHKGKRIWMGCRPAERDSNGRATLQVTVRDEGQGVPTEELQRIFERFSQVDHTDTRGTGGSGLGLAISKEIVEYHGGRIWAESVQGEGATFLFTLPCVVGSRVVGHEGDARREKAEPSERDGKTKGPSAVTKENRHA